MASGTEAPRLEGFYDIAPVEVILIGGLRGGERMPWPEPLPMFIVLTDPVPEWMLAASMYVPAGEIPAPVSISDRSTVYQRTGNVHDDGARVYLAERLTR